MASDVAKFFAEAAGVERLREGLKAAVAADDDG